MSAIRVKRGTRAQLDAAAATLGLAAGEPYLITDEGRLAVGTGAGAYQALRLEGEAAGEVVARTVSDVWIFNHLLDVDSMSLWGSKINSGTFNPPSADLASPELHPGVLRITSSTTAGSGGRIFCPPGMTSLSKNACVQCVLAVTGQATATIRAGFHDATGAADVTDGFYFQIDGLSAVGKTANGGTRSSTSAYALTAGTFYRFEIRASADYSAVTFSVYSMADALLWSQAMATNLPATGVDHWSGLGVTATSSGTTAVDLCLLDYIGGGTWAGWLGYLGTGLKGEQGETGPAGPDGVTDHGALTGLGEDHHNQYHTDARGDARYLGDAAPLACAVTASIGTSGKLARQDHVHPVPSWLARQLTANTTVNLTSSMTAAQVQALVDAQPKNLNSYALYFQFADGVYSFDASILFAGFSNGTLVLRGNLSNTAAAKTKNVSIQFAASLGALSGLRVERCQVAVVQYLYASVQAAARPLHIISTQVASISGCSFASFGTSTSAYCAHMQGCANGTIANTYFANGYGGLFVQDGGYFRATNNYVDDTALPLYGYVTSAGAIAYNGAAPVGSAGVSLPTLGGQIWS